MSRTGRIPLVSSVFRSVNNNVGSKGFVEGIQTSFRAINSKIEVQMSPTTREVLQKESVLVVSNHPFVDVFSVIAALPKREDVRLIATIELMNFAPNLNKYLLCVDTRHRKKSQKIGRIFHAIIGILNPVPYNSYEEAHKRNIDVVKSASTYINNGGLVVLFPSSNSPDGSWHKGVGYLLHDTNKDKTQIVNVKVTGSLLSEKFRTLPFLSFLIPKAEVIFSEPVSLKEVYEHDPRLIARNAENRYILWEKTQRREQYFVKRWVFNFARILDF